MVYMDPEGRALMPVSPIDALDDFDVFICWLYKRWLTCPDDSEAIVIGAVAATGFGSRVAQRTRTLFPAAAQVVLRYDPETDEHWLHTVLDAQGEPVTAWVSDGDIPECLEDRFDALCFFGACLAELTLGRGENHAEATRDLDALSLDTRALTAAVEAVR